MSEHIQIPVEAIHPSPTNPRKKFDKQQLDELAASIVAHGVVQAIKVREHPTMMGGYMLVVGERRWRAAKIAKLTHIPAVVESLTETQVLEQQIIENTQRVDVDPLDEASGYQALLDHHGYSMDDLIAKTGRSSSHLYGRLKLLKLGAVGRKALQSGKLTASVAELAARIPVMKLQDSFVKECLGEDGELRGVGIEIETITDKDPTADTLGLGYYSTQPLSFRAAHELFKRRYSLRLELASFSVADTKLVAGVGACGPCQYRSDNQPELPGLGATPGNLCTNPPCFEAKTAAAWQETVVAAKERGLEVVDGKEAERVFAHDGMTVRSESPYVELTTVLPYDLAKEPGSKVTFGKLLGKKAGDIPRVLVQDKAGAPRELIDKKVAVDLLREMGKIDKPSKPKSTPAASKEQQEKQQAKRELNEAAMQRVLGTIATNAAEDLGKKETAFWRWLARSAYAFVAYGDADIVAQRRGLEKFDDIEDVIEKLRTAGELRGLVAELFMSLDGQAVHLAGPYAHPDKAAKERWEDGLKLTGADWDAAIAAAKEAAKAETKSETAKDKRKAASK